ncbi:sulfotransferase, partial [Waterburya agarophytonicola K14]
MTNTLQHQSAIIIAGMHRSGTSLTASLLQNAGIDIGDRLMDANTGNIKGHFEDLDFVEFHQNVLQSQGISIAGWTEQDSIEVQQQYLTIAQNLISARKNKDIWGWKDPRTTLFLNFWSELIPDAKYIFVYRSPWEVVDSLFRRGDVIFRKNPNFAVKQWCIYNQAILDFYQRKPEQCLLLDITGIIRHPELIVNSIEQKWKLKLRSPESIYEPSLFTVDDKKHYRQALIVKFFPQAIDLYDRLQEQNDGDNSVHPEALAVDSTCKSWILQDWIDFQQTSTQKQQTETHLTQTQQQLQSKDAELIQIQQQLQSKDAELIQIQQQLQSKDA